MVKFFKKLPYSLLFVLVILGLVGIIGTKTAYASYYNMFALWTNGDWVVKKVAQGNQIVIYNNDSNGNCITMEFYNSEDGNIVTVGKYTYDSNGNRIKLEFDYGNDGTIDAVETYIYDSSGYMTKCENDSDNDGTIDVVETYTYDGNGDRIQYAYDYGNNGIIDIVTTYTFDSNRHVIRAEDVRADGTTRSVMTFTNTYDSNGKRVKQEIDFGNDGIIDTVNVYTWECFGSDCTPAPWEFDSSLLTARHLFTGGVIDGKIYVFGGNGDPNHTTEVYDPIAQTWSGLASNDNTGKTGDIHGLTGSVIDGKFYVFGGYCAGESFNFVEEYDPVTNVWTSKAPRPTIESGNPAIAYNGEIYFFGTMVNNDELIGDEVEVYNPSTNTWRIETNMPKSIIAPAVALFEDKIYIISGADFDETAFVGEEIAFDEIVFSQKIFVYDLSTKTWITDGYSPVPNPRTFAFGHAAPVIDGKIYLIGGFGADSGEDGCTNKVDVYDIATNTWTVGPSLPYPIREHLTLALDNSVYVISGKIEAGPNYTLTPNVWKLQLDPEDSDGDGYTENQGDCNDANAAIHPDADEVCNGVDDNCVGGIDEGFNVNAICSAGIGECEANGIYVCTEDGTGTECNAVPGEPGIEICGDGIDQDCNGSDCPLEPDDPDDVDDDNDGYTENQGDCNDANAAIHPNAVEVCNGVDDNCADGIDEGFNVNAPCSAGIGECEANGIYVCTKDGSGTECNAAPGEPGIEICGDGIDQDCNGSDEACPFAEIETKHGQMIQVTISTGTPLLKEADVELPPDLNFIYTPIGINISNLVSGATVDIYIDLPAAASEGASVYKLIDGVWTNFDDHCQFNPQRDRITFQITDGDYGDNDHAADGQIVDPIGVAVQTSRPHAINDSDGDGDSNSGSSGCFITSSMF